MSTVGIEKELKKRQRAAMKARDEQELAVLRNIRSRVSEARTAKGFSGEVDDALYLRVIASYVKSMAKAREEFLKGGEKGAELATGLAFEIQYLSEFLPQRLDEAATRELVAAAIAETGASGKKQIGRVMGVVMKEHREEVDAGLLRRLIEELLAE